MSHKFDTLSVFGGYLFLLQNKERGKENIYGMFFCLINRIPFESQIRHTQSGPVQRVYYGPDVNTNLVPSSQCLRPRSKYTSGHCLTGWRCCFSHHRLRSTCTLSCCCFCYPSPCVINKTKSKHCCPCDPFVPFPLLILPKPPPSLPQLNLLLWSLSIHPYIHPYRRPAPFLTTDPLLSCFFPSRPSFFFFPSFKSPCPLFAMSRGTVPGPVPTRSGTRRIVYYKSMNRKLNTRLIKSFVGVKSWNHNPVGFHQTRQMLPGDSEDQTQDLSHPKEDFLIYLFIMNHWSEI